MKQSLICTFTIPGFHCWEDAPVKYRYLSYLHRHLFKFKLGVTSTTDREIEFIDFGEKVKKYLTKKYSSPLKLKSSSCEMLAQQIISRFPELIWVEVWEDDENGGRVERGTVAIEKHENIERVWWKW